MTRDFLTPFGLVFICRPLSYLSDTWHRHLELGGPRIWCRSALGVDSRPGVPSVQARVLVRSLSQYLALVSLTAASQMSDVYGRPVG